MTATALDVRRRASFVGRGLRTVPGLCLLFAIGYAGKSIETFFKVYGKSHHLTLPNIEYVLWAILIGLVVGNVFGSVSEKVEHTSRARDDAGHEVPVVHEAPQSGGDQV